jgi:hypothetical protein
MLAAGVIHSVCGHSLFVTRSARIIPFGWHPLARKAQVR